MTVRRILIRTETAATFYKTVDEGNGVREGGVNLSLDAVVDGKKVREYPLGIAVLSDVEGGPLLPAEPTDAERENDLIQRISDWGDDGIDFFRRLPGADIGEA